MRPKPGHILQLHQSTVVTRCESRVRRTAQYYHCFAHHEEEGGGYRHSAALTFVRGHAGGGGSITTPSCSFTPSPSPPPLCPPPLFLLTSSKKQKRKERRDGERAAFFFSFSLVRSSSPTSHSARHSRGLCHAPFSSSPLWLPSLRPCGYPFLFLCLLLPLP